MDPTYLKEDEGGYKLDLEDNFGFAQFDLNDAMTRPRLEHPCMTLIPGHGRFAYITETQRIAIVSPEFFTFAQELGGNVTSICSALPGHLLALAEVEGEGRLYLLNEEGDVLKQKDREEPFYPFPSQVQLLTSVSNELICFQDNEGVFLIDLLNGAMFDFQIPQSALVRFSLFTSESTLLLNWELDAESDWSKFECKSRGDELIFEKTSLAWGRFLGRGENSVITFDGNDTLVHPFNDAVESTIKHLGYIAASKTDRLGVATNEKYATILTPSHLHIYQREFTGSWGKQWLKTLPPKQRVLASLILSSHFFILLPTGLISIHLKSQ